MASIVTDPFRVRNAEQFIQDVASSNFYMSIGASLPWNLRGGTDTLPPIPFDTVLETQRAQWDDMIAAKKITSADVIHAVKRYNWTAGTRYDVYDPNDAELYRKAFYIVTDEFKVYKCLARPTSGGSTVKPTQTTASVITQPDGFVWKYMYTISTNDALRFLTPQHMPVPSALSPGNVVVYLTAANNPIAADGTVGHGYDAVRELGAYFVSVNVRLEFDENGAFATENDYRKIGIFQNPRLFGSSTLATAIAYRQTTLINLSAPPLTAFQVDETVTANNGATGIVVQYDGTELYLYQTSTINFAPGNTLIGGTSGTTSTVSSVSNPGLQKYTGDTLFVEYRRPIPRSTDQVESLSIVLEF